MLEKADRCTMCGTSDSEWLEDPAAYVAVFRDCPGCRLKERQRQSEGDGNAPGRSVVLISRQEAERLQYDPSVLRHGPRLQKRTRPRRQG